MEKNKNPRLCGICNRSFSNGKAMGGHMRSHLLKLNLPSNPPSIPLYPLSLTKRKLPAEPDSPTTRRSKRLRNLALNSPTLSTEDAAICLLMLSRDHHKPNPETRTQEYTAHESLDVDVDAGNGGGASEDAENDELCSNISGKTHSKYYKCETCNKSFRSHQALGGHRASHSHKNKQILQEEENDEDCVDDDHQIHLQQRIFECPFCDKVFQSGQALGGHKKVHFAYLPTVAHQYRASITSSSTVQSFDLNFPASTADIDYEEEEASLVADSAPSIYEQSG